MDLGWFSRFINSSSAHVGFQIGVGSATINAKGDRVFGEKLVSQLSIFPIRDLASLQLGRWFRKKKDSGSAR
jgi:hypothetical protein